MSLRIALLSAGFYWVSIKTKNFLMRLTACRAGEDIIIFERDKRLFKYYVFVATTVVNWPGSSRLSSIVSSCRTVSLPSFAI